MKLSKKILLSLAGFSIGSLIILVIYFLIYIIAGEQNYIIQIIQIQNISTLLKEFITLGVSMTIAIFSLLITNDILNNKNYKTYIKVLSFALLIIGFAILPIILVDIFLGFMSVFNTTFLILWVVIVTSTSLIYIIKDFINIWIINKKIAH